jgi:hypothetical protein
VNTRRDGPAGQFDQMRVTRIRRMQAQWFHGQADIRYPYWGGSAAIPAWGLASVPDLAAAAVPLGAGQPPPASARALRDAAVADFPSVVGALSVTALQAAAAPAALARAEAFWSGAADYAEAAGSPTWLADAATDAAFLARLEAEIVAFTAPEAGLAALGAAGGILSAMAAKLQHGASDLINGPAVRLLRGQTPAVCRLVGDAFVFLSDGDRRTAIRELIYAEVLAAAQAARASGQQLILLGHSLGGVILHDLLVDPAYARRFGDELGADLAVDLLLTVGSQVSLFEELGLFGPGSGQGGRAQRAPSARRWWNVWDRMDGLAFVAAPVFDGVDDFSTDTLAGVVDAHTAYFDNAVFYQRMARRLRHEGLIA